MNNITSNEQKIKVITIWGMIVTIFLAIIKLIVGIMVNSIALIADGIHSISDLLTDITVLISNRAASKPPDLNHPYGHGKFETFGTQIIGIILISVGVGIGWKAINLIYYHKQNYPGFSLIFVSLISVVCKEVLFQYTKKIAIITYSTSLYANAWHHRSDALSSLGVILGGIVSMYGFGYGDHIAGLIVSAMILAVGFKILIDGFKELSEHAIDTKDLALIENILENFDDINHWHKLRTRKIGSQLFIDVHIHVQPALTVLESHQITKEIEKKILKAVSHPVNTLIHVEPHSEEKRADSE